MSRSAQEEQDENSEPRVEETVVGPTRNTTLTSQWLD
jgi:hypothetical protein